MDTSSIINKNIYTIVVLYHPTKEQILDKLNILQDSSLVFVDNTPDSKIDIEGIIGCKSKVTYIKLCANYGIGYAQNKGISVALNNLASHVIFVDQDSHLIPEYPSLITETYDDLRQKGINIGILGPTIIRSDNSKEYTSNFYNFKADKEGFIEKPHIISSGCVTTPDVIKKIDGLDNNLFIDYVDDEWCWRAARGGYKVGSTNKLKLRHKIGQSEFRFWKYQSIISAPFRYFYQCRNLIWLCGVEYVPFSFKVKGLAHLLIHLLLYPFFVKKGWRLDKYMIKGIWAGLTKRYIPNHSIHDLK